MWIYPLALQDSSYIHINLQMICLTYTPPNHGLYVRPHSAYILHLFKLFCRPEISSSMLQANEQMISEDEDDEMDTQSEHDYPIPQTVHNQCKVNLITNQVLMLF